MIRGVYLVTDRGLCLGRELVDIVRAALNGRLCAVQLREKDVTSREFVALGRAVAQIMKGSGVPLIINDRADVAKIIGAQGLHIGQSDILYKDAREIMGADAIIGLSIENIQQAIECRSWGLDYIGASPVFGTPTKIDTAKPLGLDGLRELRKIMTLPIVAIGGVNLGNCAQVVEAGADSVAVVSAICSATDPGLAAEQLNRFF